MSTTLALFAISALLGTVSSVTVATTPNLRLRQRADRHIVSVWISDREFLRSSVRIDVRLLLEPGDERARPLEGQIEIVDAKEQEKAVAGCAVITTHQ